MEIKKLLGFILLSACTLCVNAKSVHVAVAANFSKTMQSLAKEFEKTSEYQIVLSFGSSGKFYAQIKQGAPYELFFSADQAKPEALQKEGLVVARSRFTYAIGRLAVWSARSDFTNKIEVRLKTGSFNKLAMANPKLAPYGLATLDVLEHLALTKATQAKWVRGENIAQTYQFVGSGNADLGFVALSQLLGENKMAEGSYWLVPEIMHSPIKQDAVLLKSASQSQGAKAFLDFLRTDIAQNIIAQNGYENGYETSKGLNTEREI